MSMVKPNLKAAFNMVKMPKPNLKLAYTIDEYKTELQNIFNTMQTTGSGSPVLFICEETIPKLHKRFLDNRNQCILHELRDFLRSQSYEVDYYDMNDMSLCGPQCSYALEIYVDDPEDTFEVAQERNRYLFEMCWNKIESDYIVTSPNSLNSLCRVKLQNRRFLCKAILSSPHKRGIIMDILEKHDLVDEFIPDIFGPKSCGQPDPTEYIHRLNRHVFDVDLDSVSDFDDEEVDEEEVVSDEEEVVSDDEELCP